MLDKIMDWKDLVVKFLIDNKKKSITLVIMAGVVYMYPEKIPELLHYILTLV